MTLPILNPDSLLEQIDRLAGRESSRGGLLMIRLHGLKKMGTIFGSRTTESIIQSLGDRFQQALRPDDQLLRMGRYELAVLLHGVLNRGHTVLAASELAHILEFPVEIGQRNRKLSFSIGISLLPEHSSDPETLLRYAELAAISARHARLPYQLYSEIDPESGVISGWDIEGELEQALTNDELSLHYQPKISADSGHLPGAEALRRWQHPEKGSIPPDRFIPIAERIGLMPKLTWWCLNT
ncbi:MAG: EAL domain-containing protein, partial [Sedimenticola sp.]|nr:EAL domain-containing protein [Sedimenticola sp.]